MPEALTQSALSTPLAASATAMSPDGASQESKLVLRCGPRPPCPDLHDRHVRGLMSGEAGVRAGLPAHGRPGKPMPSPLRLVGLAAGRAVLGPERGLDFLDEAPLHQDVHPGATEIRATPPGQGHRRGQVGAAGMLEDRNL